MNKTIILLIVVGGLTGAVVGMRTFVPSEAPIATGGVHLPVNATRGVLGSSDVVAASAADPLLAEVSTVKSGVSAIPASLASDGAVASTVVVTLKTDDGAVVQGADVTLESSRGQQDQIEIVRGITGADGQAIFLVRSLESGTAIFTVSAGTKMLDERATLKFTDPPTTVAGYNRQLLVVGIAVLFAVLLFQYFFVRIVLSAKTRAESELFFHHPESARGK